jgi:hypothetical protein
VARTLARVAHRAANSPDQPSRKCPLRRDARRPSVTEISREFVRRRPEAAHMCIPNMPCLPM